MLHLLLRQSIGGPALVEDLPLPQQLRFSTNEHGFADLTCFFPLSLARAFHFYGRVGLPHVEVAPIGGGIAWVGRLEDVSIVASGVRLTAFGYQRLFSDVPYSALWSSTRVADWRVYRKGDDSAHAEEGRWQIDTNNRLYITAQKNATLGNTGTQKYGALAFDIPHRSDRQIVRVDFDYDFTNPAGSFTVALLTYTINPSTLAPTFIATEWSTSTPGTGSQSINLSAACDRLLFLIRRNAADAVYTGETGSDYLKITNLRVRSSTLTTLGASAILSGMIGSLVAINSQLNSSTALVDSTNYDLKDEVYEDAIPADIASRLVALGDNQTPPRQWEWGIWEGRRVHFRVRGSAGRTWYVDAQPDEIQRTLELLHNSAYGIYQDVNGRTLRTAVSSDDDSLARYQFTRQAGVSASTTSDTQAGNQRNAFLEDAQDPSPRIGFALDSLYDASGVAWPYWAVRSGDTIVVRNLPVTLSTDIDRLRSFRVAETDYAVESNQMRLTPETPLPRLEVLLARQSA